MRIPRSATRTTLKTRTGALFVHAVPVDLVSHGIEEALAQDDLYLLMDGDPTPATRTIHVAQIEASWVAVWDPRAVPGEGFPDGDPGSSLAQGLSAAVSTDVLHLFGYASGFADGWGYILYKSGLAVDRFASDPRRLAVAFEIEDEDVDGLFRGAPAELAHLLVPERTEEELTATLLSGEESMHAFLECLGIPPGVTTSERALTRTERELTLTLRFAERL